MMNRSLIHRKTDHFPQSETTHPEPPALLAELLSGTGVSFNGDRPWDIQIHDAEAYQRILTRGSLGFGEAFMEGLWSCPRLDECFHRLLRSDLDRKIRRMNWWRLVATVLRYKLVNLQSPERAFQVAERHYNTGNDVFEAMLDPSMSYSCGYWENAVDLQQAQQHKLALICEKLELRPGERLLDVGCGWGGLAQFAAAHYGVEVLGITVSREQQQLARERCSGLPVQIELTDYRDLRGRFDKLVSVGMFEHVGTKNYTAYFDAMLDLMSQEGLFLLHTIGDYRTVSATDPWIDRYIFPNGKLPSARSLTKALEERFLIEDLHNFGQDYDRTLMAWWENFDAAWPTLRHKYGDRFYRMWRYYLMSCAGFFRSRQGQLWQLVLSKRGRSGVYRSVRSRTARQTARGTALPADEPLP